MNVQEAPVSSAPTNTSSDILQTINNTPLAEDDQLIRNDFSGKHLLEVLCDKKIAIENFSKTWIESVLTNLHSGLEQLIELSLQASGWSSYKYEVHKISEEILNNYVINGPVDKICLALDDIFVGNFSQFIRRVMSYDNGYFVLSCEEFVQKLKLVSIQLIRGHWSSLRTIATCVGMSLMTVFHELDQSLRVKIMKTNDSVELVVLRKFQMHVFDYWLEIFRNIFQRSIRDVNWFVRKLVLDEMMYWSKTMPDLLFDKKWNKYILWAVRDSSPPNRTSALMTVLQLFSNVKDDQSRRILFDTIKNDLIALLHVKGFPSEASMKTLASAVWIFPVELNDEQTERINALVLHPNLIVAYYAAEFIYAANFQSHFDPNILFKLLIDINSKEKNCEDIVVESFLSILNKKTNWSHWCSFIAKHMSDEVKNVVKLFYCYARAVNENYFCPFRYNIKWFKEVVADSMQPAKESFTFKVKNEWLVLAKLDKLKKRPQLLLSIIEVVPFFDNSLPPSTAIEIMGLLLDMIQVCDDEDCVTSGLEGISHLSNTINWTSNYSNKKTNILKSLSAYILQNFSEFLEIPHFFSSSLIKSQIIGLSKHFDFDDDQIWENCCEALIKYPPTSRNVEVSNCIILTIHHLFLRKYKRMWRLMEVESDQYVDYVSATVSRGRAHEIKLIEIIKAEDIPLPSKILVYFLLINLVECFGAHLGGHPSLWVISGHLDSQLPGILMEFVNCVLGQYSEKYADVAYQKSEHFGECCMILEKFTNLLSTGKVSFKLIKGLLEFVGKDKSHDLIILSGLRAYTKKYPNYYKQFSAGIFGGMISILEKHLSLGKSREEAVKETEFSVMNWVAQPKFSQSMNERVITTVHYLVLELAVHAPSYAVVLSILKPLRPLLHPDHADMIIKDLKLKSESNLLSDADLRYIDSYSSFLKSNIGANRKAQRRSQIERINAPTSNTVPAHNTEL